MTFVLNQEFQFQLLVCYCTIKLSSPFVSGSAAPFKIIVSNLTNYIPVYLCLQCHLVKIIHVQ